MRGRLHLDLSWSAKSIKGIDDLEDDLRKMSEIFCNTVITKAADKITEFAEDQMYEFYAEYTPLIYNRTNQMGKSSYQKYINSEDDIYQGGIEIDSGFTSHPDVGFNNGEDQIYINVWDLGIHGYLKKDPYYYLNTKGKRGKKRIYVTTDYKTIQGKPHRIDEIVKKIQNPGFQNRLKTSGLSAMTKGNYSVLKFV